MTAAARGSFAVVLFLSLARCDGCLGCGGDPVAELVSLADRVDRDHASSLNDWNPAREGDRFDVGDGVRTGERGVAELALFPDGIMRVESRTLVRFQDTPPGQRERRVEVESGAIELESSTTSVQVRTSAGMASVTPGSRVRVGRNGGGLGFEVLVGKVKLQQGQEFGSGQQFEVDVGKLVIESAQAEVAAAQVQPVADAGRPPDELPEGPATPVSADQTGARPTSAAGRFDSQPASAHMALSAGESAVIHDPHPPTHVQLGLSNCPGEAAVEVSRSNGKEHSRVRGTGTANLRLQAGRYRYRVRCFDEAGGLQRDAVTQGRVSVLRDAGVRRLPRSAPRVTVDADGRRYTVRYQNLLPHLTLRWPSAPAGPLVLDVTSPGGKHQSYRLDEAQRVFKSGSLGEGEHQFSFRAGERRSPQGKLVIAFDNTSRAAYLSEPGDGTVAQGGRVLLAGAALVHSQVSVGGTDVTLHDQGRFRQEVPVSPGLDALSVRVQHPATGVHYYLRRLSSP